MTRKEKGITLIALIITIIVLLIIAGISIGALTTDNSIIKQAQRAKISTEEAEIMETLKESYVVCMKNNRRAIVKEDELQDEINKTYPDAEVAKEAKKFIVIINEKYYEIDDDDGEIDGPKEIETIDTIPGDITKGGTCTGTAANPFKIECIEDLVKLSEMSYNNQTKTNTKYYLVVRDLDFNSIFSYANHRAKYKYDTEKNAYIPDESSSTTIMHLCTTGQGFIPIGYSYGNNDFEGTFYGEELRKIDNIYINASSCSTGLFGECRYATIRNIAISGNITCTGTFNTAGLIAVGYSCKLYNCHNKAKITNTSTSTSAAGIFCSGRATTITGCSNEGEITSGGSASGIARNGPDVITNCINTGKVTGNGYISGITGAPSGNGPVKAINCGNTGEIVSTGQSAAGIIAGGGGHKIYNCYNLANVTAGRIGFYNGGHRGVAGMSTVSNTSYVTGYNCCTTGIVRHTSGDGYQASGIIFTTGSTLNNCYYLQGTESQIALTPEPGAIPFVKTSVNPADMTSQKMVDTFNQYIDDHLNDEDAETNTSEWLRWEVGESGFPELIFE